jgi:hypothetical protein
MEFRVIFSSAERFGTEFRHFLFRGTTGIPSEITICFVYSVFRGIIFLSEIPNPSGGADRLGGLPGGGRTCLVASGDGPVHLRSHLAKLAAEAFIVEQLMGEGLGDLEAFRDEGEWISVAESFEMLCPYE